MDFLEEKKGNSVTFELAWIESLDHLLKKKKQREIKKKGNHNIIKKTNE